MRVIAGRYKGRKLVAPEGRDIRPTTDKTKEAMFSILTARTPGAKVLDVFAGTGALGIEALSRGAESCIFCDRSRESDGCIRANLDHCGIRVEPYQNVLGSSNDVLTEDEDEAVAALCTGDVTKTLPRIGELSHGGFDIIIMDPPYKEGLCEKTLEIISREKLLAQGGIIICEHRKEEMLPGQAGDFIMIKQRRYGISMLSIYEHNM